MRQGNLFGALWSIVEPHEAQVTLRPWRGRHAEEFVVILSLLETATMRDVPASVMDYLEDRAVPFSCEVLKAEERAFVVMCALDQAAEQIHPSIKKRITSRASSTGTMLASMRTERTMTGAYAEIAGKGLVMPKGHLMPGRPRTKSEEESGTALSHHFSYLSFIPAPVKYFTLRPLAVPPSLLSVSEDAAGRVGLAPIAEDRDDLEFAVSDRNKRAFLDTIPKTAALADRTDAQVSALLDKGAGLIVLPELVSSVDAVDRLSESLRKAARSQRAVVLAGSGPSKEMSDGIGRPYNEAVIMNAVGEELFRQRKLNAFNMRWKRMEECGLPRSDGYERDSHMEDCSTGEELVICDIHGLGRILVLICEDLEQQTPGGDICLHALPDWVLTPVLDVGLAFGRWEHQRAIEIGRKTLSRFVVSCSATLQVRSLGKNKLTETKTDEVVTGFCLDGLNGLRTTSVATGGPDTEHHNMVEWKTDGWDKHRIVRHKA
ncbi:hypothetical protein HFO73_28360 [Rhizobium laguerreae]|uniref:hypothetical protein n=1 Tax=Rhizobium laguerreae TaxID=1076926 RepID=UPI001C911CC8|nr:hypothetical protein [Rhizobium laguerreae]MBY3081092.1 hypothetical protein [Rhizobium laguerreae]